MLQRGHTKEHYEEGSIFYRALLKRNMVDPSSKMCALLVRVSPEAVLPCLFHNEQLAIRAGEVNDLIGLIDNVRILLPRRTCAALFLYFQRQGCGLLLVLCCSNILSLRAFRRKS